MAAPLRCTFAAILLSSLGSVAGAQQIWIESVLGMGPGEKPNGFRYDHVLLGNTLQVNFRYTATAPTFGNTRVWRFRDIEPRRDCVAGIVYRLLR